MANNRLALGKTNQIYGGEYTQQVYGSIWDVILITQECLLACKVGYANIKQAQYLIDIAIDWDEITGRVFGIHELAKYADNTFGIEEYLNESAWLDFWITSLRILISEE